MGFVTHTLSGFAIVEPETLGRKDCFMDYSYSVQRELLWLVFVGLAITGCGSANSSSEPSPKRMVYVDTATMRPLVHDVAASFPAIHPKTGKPTLRPALYCPSCKKWYAAPDIDQVNRVPGAGQCRQDKTPLTAEGPWPEDNTAASSEAVK